MVDTLEVQEDLVTHHGSLSGPRRVEISKKKLLVKSPSIVETR